MWRVAEVGGPKDGWAERLVFGVGVFTCSWSHSEAAAVALVITSSAVLSLLLKVRLFRASQRDHKIQGARGPREIPVGGRQVRLQSPVHTVDKSSKPLESTQLEKGASFQTLCAKSQ